MATVHTEIRSGRLSMFSFFFFVVLAFSLLRLQILQGDYYSSLSEKNRIRLIYLEGPRGKISDRLGRPIATNRLSFNCTAFLKESKTKISKSFERLSVILNEDVETIREHYQKKKAGMYSSVLLAEDITPEQAIAIEEESHRMPGLMIETRPRRQYPLGEAAAHVTGYIGPQTALEEEALEFTGYRASDWIGRDGLEKSFESYLRGRSGGLQVEVNNRGHFLKVLGVREPKEGRDIQLTLDADLQTYVQKKFQGRRGAVIVMELATGGILAMNSSPSYDPNLFTSTRGRKDVGKYLKDSMSPMFNRSIQGQYPPGSIFKIITGLAALEPRKITEGSRFHCPGFYALGKRVFRCWNEKGHGSQGLTEAYAHSCDVFFYMTGLAAGVDAIHRKSVEFGFSVMTGIDLPHEKSGLVPSRAWKQKNRRDGWYDGDTLNFSIGQGFLQVTPIQALQMIATTATNGQRLRPHLVDKIDGLPVAERHASAVIITPEYLRAVKAGLDAVVNSDTGTGRLARIPGVRVAGKTGTSETGKKEGATHAWFVGYAPAEHPKVALVVFLEYGGHGGVEAATVAHGVLEQLKEKGYL